MPTLHKLLLSTIALSLAVPGAALAKPVTPPSDDKLLDALALTLHMMELGVEQMPDLVQDRDGNIYSDQDVYVARVARDGKVTFHDRPNIRLHGLGLRFDVTDWMMRRHGMDPYASSKLAFLDRTRELRYEIGRQYRNEQLEQSDAYMRRNIERAMASTREVRERKEILFQLWDEVAEAGSPELVDGGDLARRALVHYIRTKLVGTDAYSQEELLELNARKASFSTFDPYGTFAPPARDPGQPESTPDSDDSRPSVFAAR